MKIRELRILPPFAIARLGSAEKPQDNFTIDDDPNQPLGYRKIVPKVTLEVDEETGEIKSSARPKKIVFKVRGKIRPVAPFLEVFAVLDDPGIKEDDLGNLVPLDLDLLTELGVG